MNKHHRVAMLLTLSVLATLGFTGSGGAGRVLAQTGPSFEADLRGVQEVPPVSSATKGRARIQFNDNLTRADFELEVEKGKAITQAHIHCGPRGVNGPVVVFLAGFHERGWNVDGNWIGDAQVTNDNIVNTSCGATLRQLAASMRRGQTYVNVHSVAFPGGVARGQLRLAGGS